MKMGQDIIVIKRNLAGEETWRYPGKVLRQTHKALLLEAWFNRDAVSLQDIQLLRGDRFLEIYFSDRWYNIDAIYDQADGHLKGWYCNIALPAVFEEGSVSYVDLALDLLVYPDGSQVVLDEDEFAVMPLSPEQRRLALMSLEELRRLLRTPGGIRLEEWVEFQE
jgi:protein associated with RNAse G/E